MLKGLFLVILFCSFGILYAPDFPDPGTRDIHPGWYYRVRVSSETSGTVVYQGGEWGIGAGTVSVSNLPQDYAREGTLSESKDYTKVVSTLTGKINEKIFICDTNDVKTSSPQARVTVYPSFSEVRYFKTQVSDQSYGLGTQLGAGATRYWTILDGTQTEDYYLKSVGAFSEASLVWLILYTSGDGATDFWNTAYNNAIYLDQSSTYHKDFNVNLDDYKIPAGTPLRYVASNTSASAGDLVLRIVYMKRNP